MLIENFSHEKEGYNPYLFGPKWQVAQLNYELGLVVDAIAKIDIHHKRDETFLLMDGQAVLIVTEMVNGTPIFELIDMETKVLFNIPKDCWHNIVMSEDAQVLITEDADTHMGDFEFYHLNDSEKEALKQQIKAVWINE